VEAARHGAALVRNADSRERNAVALEQNAPPLV
jgi:hypothetical protein